MTPVYFGTALGNFSVREMLDDFVEWAPGPLDRETESRTVAADDSSFSGFVFKIQANMDPKHRDRIAFMRICSGEYQKGMKMHHSRIGKEIKVSDAVTFVAGDRAHVLRLRQYYLVGKTYEEPPPCQRTFWPHIVQRVQTGSPR